MAARPGHPRAGDVKRYRLHLDLLPAALGVSARTIRRWKDAGLLDVDARGYVDDMQAQAVRDAMRARRAATLRRGGLK